MEITREDAQNMDLVLSYLLKNDKARMKSKQVQELLKISFDESHHIYELILKYHYDIEPVVSILNAENISASTGITESFLGKGGFTSIYNLQVDNEMITKSEKPKDMIESRWVKWQIKTYWFTFIVAVLGFVIALFSLLVNLGILNLK